MTSTLYQTVISNIFAYYAKKKNGKPIFKFLQELDFMLTLIKDEEN